MELNNQIQSSCRHNGIMPIKLPVRFLVLAFLMLFAGTNAFGQTWEEFFNQKKTQNKYLLEQLVALKAYAGYVKKGYDIVGSGIGAVRDIKNGEFSLHSTFISSLKNVSPAIKKNAKVADIFYFQTAIVNAFKSIDKDDGLNLSDHQYVMGVKAKVTDDCLDDMEALLMVITTGRLEMSDDERMERLYGIYKRVQDKAVFVQRFTADVNLLIQQKDNEQKSINHLREIYGNE